MAASIAWKEQREARWIGLEASKWRVAGDNVLMSFVSTAKPYEPRAQASLPDPEKRSTMPEQVLKSTVSIRAERWRRGSMDTGVAASE